MRSLVRWSSDDLADIVAAGPSEVHRVAAEHHTIIITSPPGDVALNAFAAAGVIVAAVEPAAGSRQNATADLWLQESEVERFSHLVTDCPMAAVICARQLRLVEALDPHSLAGASRGLEAESLSYATLQSGPEFNAWLGRQPRRVRKPADQGRVTVRETAGTQGTHVEVELDRPRLKNALDAAMRNHLVEVLDALTHRTDIANITLCGNGSAFSIGGDLAEFGTVDSPTDAHLIRLATSLGNRLLNIGPKLHARVHGPTIGAGVELAAFADTVVAAPGTTFRLPEVAMGLLPGAGGTVSLTRRCGRHAAARLLLLDEAINVEQAQAIGLVDHVDT